MEISAFAIMLLKNRKCAITTIPVRYAPDVNFYTTHIIHVIITYR